MHQLCKHKTIRTSKHMLSISCDVVTNKLSCQFDAAKNVAFSRNNICYLVAILFSTYVEKNEVRTITLCFASVKSWKCELTYQRCNKISKHLFANSSLKHLFAIDVAFSSTLNSSASQQISKPDLRLRLKKRKFVL